MHSGMDTLICVIPVDGFKPYFFVWGAQVRALIFLAKKFDGLQLYNLGAIIWSCDKVARHYALEAVVILPRSSFDFGWQVTHSNPPGR